MVRVKVLAHKLMNAAAWAGIATLTLGAAYGASAAAAHMGTLIHWR